MSDKLTENEILLLHAHADALREMHPATCRALDKMLISRPAAEAGSAGPGGEVVLTEAQMEKIAHDCETECHAVPGTNMWQCAYMAIEATLKAVSTPYTHAHIAEVFEDRDGFKHIEAVIEDLDDIPAGTKLCAQPAAVASKEAVTLSDAELTLLAETADQFGDCNETSTAYSTLMRWASMGLLECERFTVTAAGEAALAQRDASKAEATPSTDAGGAGEGSA